MTSPAMTGPTMTGPTMTGPTMTGPTMTGPTMTGPTMTDAEHEQDVARRLLDSAATLSYDPEEEVDWDAPLGETEHGMSPEWCSLYGTPLWDELTEAQRVALTREEAASVASTGIWFEMILQQMMLRDQYAKNPAEPSFQWALTEIADECRHSIMFARGCAKMTGTTYTPARPVLELARGFKALAGAETAYAGILVAEEVLDVMQRDWMRDERVAPSVRMISKIHVVEESRHMKFAREEVRQRMRGVSTARRRASATLVATTAYFIVTSMVNPGVYAAAGLPDPERAKREARHNEHYHTMLRSSCAHLMDFLGEAGLLTRPAKRLYQRAHML